MEGPALDELNRIAAATEAQVIASGGVGDLSDLEDPEVMRQAWS